MAAGSPWGDGPSNNGTGGGGSGGPSNPWQPSGNGDAPGKSSSVEDLFKPRGGGGPGKGGGGLSGLPKLPNGRSYIPLLVIVLVVLWVVMTCIWRIGPQEQGVVKFFGSYSRTVGPGINWTLPAPFETMDKVDTQAIRETPIGSPNANDENFVLLVIRTLSTWLMKSGGR